MEYSKILFASSAYIFWGIFLPLSIGAIQPYESNAFSVMIKRVFWCIILFTIIQLYRRRWQDMLLCFIKRNVIILIFSSIFLFTNWVVFIYAMQVERLSEAALGYFIMPFFNILSGLVLFKERLSSLQMLAIMISGIGVGIVIYATGSLPLIALTVAFSFNCYGVLRKWILIDNMTAFWFELLIMGLILIIWYIIARDREVFVLFNLPWQGQCIMVLMAIFTIVPLLIFNISLRYIGLGLMGVLSWLAPSFQFLLSVFYYKEDMDALQLLSFIFIWSALLLYGISLYRQIYQTSRKVL